jgi:hypothetical protein
LEDPGFKLPDSAPLPEEPPAHPSLHAAGGEWPDDEELEVPPAEGPPPHPKPIKEPFAPGTSHAGERIDPATRELLGEEEDEE